MTLGIAMFEKVCSYFTVVHLMTILICCILMQCTAPHVKMNFVAVPQCGWCRDGILSTGTLCNTYAVKYEWNLIDCFCIN